jgi:hypothetical protein
LIPDRLGAPAGPAQDRHPPEAGLPAAWCAAAREPIAFELPSARRPWNWLEADQAEAATMWRVLAGFVDYLNQRYAERSEQQIPHCWAEHGALVEELTTLFWSRWLAFESAQASVAAAESFNAYSLPGFLERMAHWLGPERLRRCQAGRHEDRMQDDAPTDLGTPRRSQIACADIALRRPPSPDCERRWELDDG